MSQALVVAQVAISLLLVVAAGLFVRTLTNLNAIQLGFNQENVLLVTVNARQAGYKRRRVDALSTPGCGRGLRRSRACAAVTFSNYATASRDRAIPRSVQIPGQPAETQRGTTVMNVGAGLFRDDADSACCWAAISMSAIPAASQCRRGERALRQDLSPRRESHRPAFPAAAATSWISRSSASAKTARLNSLKRDLMPRWRTCPYNAESAAVARPMTYELRAAGDPLSLAAGVRRRGATGRRPRAGHRRSVPRRARSIRPSGRSGRSRRCAPASRFWRC